MICAQIGKPDLAGCPVHVFTESRGFAPSKGITGYTCQGLFNVVRPFLSDNRPGPVIVLCDHGLRQNVRLLMTYHHKLTGAAYSRAEFRRRYRRLVWATLVHELAHVLESSQRNDAPTITPSRAKPFRELCAVKGIRPRDDVPDVPKWNQGGRHDWRFLRVLSHLVDRARRARIEFYPSDLFHRGYGIESPLGCYESSLRHEVIKHRGRPLRELPTEPPADFKQLWEHDVGRAQGKHKPGSQGPTAVGN